MFKKGHKINVGRKCSEETKKKIGLWHRGKKVTEEFREKMRIINTGKKMSNEAREKMRQSRLGKKLTQETKIKIGKANAISLKGKALSNETKEKISVANKGEKNYFWGGGKRITKAGYVYVKNDLHPYCTKDGYVMEQRLVMEEKIGRYLLPSEHVHHINKNTNDNSPNNLSLFNSNSEHVSYHHSLGDYGHCKKNIKAKQEVM